MKIQIRLVLILFNSCLCLYGQENPRLDSLLNVLKTQKDDTLKVLTLEELFLEEFYTDPTKAKKYIEEGLELSKKLNFPNGEGFANYYLGAGYYQTIGKNDSARYYINEALDIFKRIKHEEYIIKMTNALGVVEYTSGNYQKAIEYYNIGINYSRKNRHWDNLANRIGNKSLAYIKKGDYNLGVKYSIESLKLFDSLNSKSNTLQLKIHTATAAVRVGYAEMGLKNYEKALEYFERALGIYDGIDDIVHMGHTYSDIGNVNLELGNYDSAIENYMKALDIAKKKKIPIMRGHVLINLGKTYIKKGDYEKALYILKEGLPFNEQFGTKDNLSLNFNQLGNAYLKNNDENQALVYYNKSIALADSINAAEILSDVSLNRAELYYDIRQYRNAYLDQKRYQFLNDSIFNSKKSQQIEELRTIYDTEKKEQQIALQEKEITVLEQQAEISALQKILLGIGLLLSLIGIYAIRQKMKRNMLEKEKVDAELEFKKKELTTHALNLARKNETLENLKSKAQELKDKENMGRGYNQLIRTINFDLQDDNNWENFSRYFEEVHKDFNSNVKTKYPQVTSNELRLLALLKMNLSSKAIANILNISPEGIKKARYRLRKKLDLSTEDSLQDLVLSL
ncbi:tetratricopeptide repeat protein [Maribacter sp. CXY002]|uniref:tetratricopeptide repeat protein n=1 Tax=Maribacter luteocoastalis TaxID=3407671 RepID=UPI003B67530F